MEKINPLLLDVPTELTTDRLMLRTTRSGDGKLVYPSVRESLAELKIWMPWATDAYSEQSAEEWCRKSEAEFITREQLQYRILSKDGSTHLGGIGAFEFRWDVPRCEIGYWLHSNHTGRGLMTEAVNGLTTLAFERLKMSRVEIRCDDHNGRSARVAELAGYMLEGVLKCQSRTPSGELRDTRIYARIA